MLRDGAHCWICGEGPREGDAFQIDHVVPFSVGGSDDLTNKRLAHGSCNRRKNVG
jgi:5-methylcytosine-specific restriction endonuclease McrA